MIVAQLTGSWELYGPMGLIMAALLGAFGYLYRDKVARERELDERHYKERKEWVQEAKGERAEIMSLHAKAWEESRMDMRTYLTDSTAATRALESAVRDLHIEAKAKRMAEEKE